MSSALQQWVFMARISLTALAFLVAAGLAASQAAAAGAAAGDSATQGCGARDGGLAVSRVVEIDASSGPLFGDITSQIKEASFLKPKEVVLTFDDGPMPWVTSSILDTLDSFCTKATFFSVGKMAIAYPSMLRKVVERGHTLGGHTWSHPLNLKRLKIDKAMAEIEKGMAAVSLASGGQAAPFFRFPGLSDNASMLAALQERGIASFSVDVVSDDSYISNPAKLVATTLSRVESRKGGILLFHDIKPATAKALPTILSELKKRGYRVVHMRAKAPVKPLADYTAALQPILAKRDPPQGQAVARAAMLPFYGAIGPERVAARFGADNGASNAQGPTVQVVAPPPRERSARSKADTKASADAEKRDKAGRKNTMRHTRQRAHPAIGEPVSLRGFSTGESWSAQVRRERLNRTFFD